MVYDYFPKSKSFYCREHKISFKEGSTCVQCPKREIQTNLTNNLLTNTNNSRRVYVRKKLVERFHSYRLKFEADVAWSHLFSYEEFSLNNNVKFKRIDFPEAIVRVFRKSILVTLRSSQEIKGLDVKEAEKRSRELIMKVVSKLPSAIKVKESKLSSVHNAFINHPYAEKDINVTVDGEKRFITDHSHGKNEFEAINTKFAISDSEAIENDVKALIDKGLTRDFIAQSIYALIQDREYYADNLRSHVIAIKELAFMLKRLNRKNKIL